MKKSLLFFALVLASYGTIQAQVTTSSMSGVVTESTGHATAGATIKATHVPSGTNYSGSANVAGRFNLANMRVGGPYRVEVTYVGQTPVVYEDIYLELGQPFILNTVFGGNSILIDEVGINGRKDPLLNSDRTGATTTVSRGQIDKLPSITRSVNDLTRLTPQANGTSIGGGNFRSNNFTLDGANFNNQFGIGQNIPANGSPISLDAIEQISVNVTPYDVRQSGFTGAAINAVTRSGRNEFFGSVFYSGRTQNQQGSRVKDATANIVDFEDKYYGISVGGPIIKDKLFFFLNTEFNKTVRPGPDKVASIPGVREFGSSSFVARPSEEFLNEVSSYLRNTYGYETGPYQGYSNDENNDKIFARIDWNIADNHKLNFRYSQVQAKSPVAISSSVSGANIPSGIVSGNRTGINALHFQNSNYFQENNLYSGTLEYIGKIGNLNHSFRASLVNQNEPRSSGGGLFPLVDIMEGNQIITTFGYEPFTYGNLRDVRTYTFNYDANYVLGNHNFTGGLQFESSNVKNGFQRFGTGYYLFRSWDDFVNNERPLNYALTYPLTADGSQAFPGFKFNQYSFFLQDEFTVNSRLKLTGGVRLELPTYPNVREIQTHPLVAELTFANGEQINTGNLPNASLMVSPRFGFNYDVLGDRSLQLRGGSGIFTGRIPFVWIVAQSGDAGMLQSTVTSSGANTPFFNPDIRANYPSVLPAAGTSIPQNISAMANDLKFPQTWKSSLAVDYKLPYGLVATVEGIYNKDLYAIVARNPNFVDPQALNIEGYPDNRMVYPSGANRFIHKLNRDGLVQEGATGQFNPTVLDNAKGGHYWSVMFQLTKQFSDGFSGSLAYVRSDARSFNDGAGSQIANVFTIPEQSSGNPNMHSLSYTDNVIPNRLVGSVSYTGSWIGKMNTGITLFYSGGEQGRYSYMYANDFNGDNSQNDLIYIPRDASEINFAPIAANNNHGGFSADEQRDRFFQIVEGDSYLRSRKGRYAERAGAVLPWRNQFDLRISQEILKNLGGLNNKLEVYWDVFNVGNLISPNWGTRDIARNQLLEVVQTPNPTTTEAPQFRMVLDGNALPESTIRKNETVSSTYFMQFGVRLSFN
ncbi:TonB-dependent receptor [Sphingobacterium griseoflavum]|uniref:Cell envelope biogenesis protein OmpA n=1 Tax=Sphingobacterium griseoflavum TaxID=1474952 RepID=A0ABQ3HTV6_9SPHI|nr:TonB-dependent receptor [Sphingobacterium griseoflavum]GHE34153.1 cell envelope biogenesis protein OmpA [Sphingobacterium griseoflavum]